MNPALMYDRSQTVAITFDDGFLDSFEWGFKVLSSLGMKATWFVVTDYIGKVATWQDSSPEARCLVGLEQLREMMQAGMEIGSHTRSHPRLTKLSIRDKELEIRGSKEDLEHSLGCKVDSFAYPFGDLDNDVIATVQQAGYNFACTTSSGRIGDNPDPLRLKRISIFTTDSAATLARKLALADNDVGLRRTASYIINRFSTKCRTQITQMSNKI